MSTVGRRYNSGLMSVLKDRKHGAESRVTVIPSIHRDTAILCLLPSVIQNYCYHIALLLYL